MIHTIPTDSVWFTVLESGGKHQHPLCKKFTKTLTEVKKEAYQNQFFFSAFELEFDGFDDFATALGDLQNEQYACVILGRLDPAAPPLIRRLKYDDLDRSGPEHRSWIEDVPSKVVHFDFDNLDMPDCLDWQDPELVAGFVVEQFQDQLGLSNDVSYYWQASNSAAVGGSRIAKIHIWMLSDTALDGPERKALYRLAGSDDAIGSSVHIQYTARPLFSGIEDPLTVRSGTVHGTSSYLPVSELMSALKPLARASSPDVVVTKDHLQQVNDLGNREINIIQKRLRQIKDNFYRNCISGNRNNALNRAAFEIGTLAHYGIFDVNAELAQLAAYAVGQGHASNRAKSTIKSGFDSGCRRIFQISPPNPSVNVAAKIQARRKKLLGRNGIHGIEKKGAER